MRETPSAGHRWTKLDWRVGTVSFVKSLVRSSTLKRFKGPNALDEALEAELGDDWQTIRKDFCNYMDITDTRKKTGLRGDWRLFDKETHEKIKAVKGRIFDGGKVPKLDEFSRTLVLWRLAPELDDIAFFCQHRKRLMTVIDMVSPHTSRTYVPWRLEGAEHGADSLDLEPIVLLYHPKRREWALAELREDVALDGGPLPPPRISPWGSKAAGYMTIYTHDAIHERWHFWKFDTLGATFCGCWMDW